MTILDLLNKYRNKLKSQNVEDQHAALGFALQLPGICGRLEFPQSNVNTQSATVPHEKALYKKHGATSYDVLDRNMFCFWFEAHKGYFFFQGFYFDFDKWINKLYAFRNNFVHEGTIKLDDKQVIFVDFESATWLEAGNILFLSLYNFCNCIFNLSERIFTNIGSRFNKPIEFSPFDTCCIDNDRYHSIDVYTKQAYSDFWANYSDEDTDLFMLYTHIIEKDKDIEANIEKYFKKIPNGIYQIETETLEKYDIGAVPDDVLFFSKAYLCFIYINGKYQVGLKEKVVCRLTYQQIQRMLVVVSEMDQLKKEIALNVKALLGIKT